MLYLLMVSLLWAFSFGLIKGQLAGLNPGWVAFIRLSLSFLLYMPFIRPLWKSGRSVGIWAAIGALQFGVMYMLYIASYRWLQAWQVALFTVTTPIYVSLFYDGVKKRIHKHTVLAVMLAVTAAAWIVFTPGKSYALSMGFFLLQGANMAFAAGQVAYKIQREKRSDVTDSSYMAAAYLGAALTALLYVLLSGSSFPATLSMKQVMTLIYLGFVATGVGFWGWNKGAVMVSGTVLAVFNNVKIPLAILISILIFDEQANIIRLLSGSLVLLAALYIAFKPKESIINESV